MWLVILEKLTNINIKKNRLKYKLYFYSSLVEVKL